MPRIVPLLVLAALVAGACGDADEADAPGDSTTPAGSSPATSPPDPTPSDPTSPDTTPPDGSGDPPASTTPTDVAVADLIARLGTSEQPEVVLSEEVTWRNGSIGCPEPGTSYTQALVPGYRIVLDVGGVAYHYHGATGEAPFYCANPSEPVPPGGGAD